MYFTIYINAGVTLKGANSHVLWNPESTSAEEEYPRANKLIVKQILLGVEAKEGEYNVVEVKCKDLITQLV